MAALDVIADLGEQAPSDALPGVGARYTAKWIEEAVAPVDAARRASAFGLAAPLAAPGFGGAVSAWAAGGDR